jgi:hypothetical protein
MPIEIQHNLNPLIGGPGAWYGSRQAALMTQRIRNKGLMAEIGTHGFDQGFGQGQHTISQGLQQNFQQEQQQRALAAQQAMNDADNQARAAQVNAQIEARMAENGFEKGYTPFQTQQQAKLANDFVTMSMSPRFTPQERQIAQQHYFDQLQGAMTKTWVKKPQEMPPMEVDLQKNVVNMPEYGLSFVRDPQTGQIKANRMSIPKVDGAGATKEPTAKELLPFLTLASKELRESEDNPSDDAINELAFKKYQAAQAMAKGAYQPPPPQPVPPSGLFGAMQQSIGQMMPPPAQQQQAMPVNMPGMQAAAPQPEQPEEQIFPPVIAPEDLPANLFKPGTTLPDALLKLIQKYKGQGGPEAMPPEIRELYEKLKAQHRAGQF